MIDINYDQQEELDSALTEGVADEDDNDVRSFLTDLGVNDGDTCRVCDQLLHVGAKASEVGGCFCFGCPYDLTEAIDDLRKLLQEIFTVCGDKYDL